MTTVARWLLLAILSTSLRPAGGQVDDLDGQLAEVRKSAMERSTTLAIEKATALTKTHPNDARVWTLRAGLYDLARQFAEAEKDYAKAIETSPADPIGYQRRGEVRFRRADIAGSLADFDQYLTFEPRAKPGHWQRGISLYYAGRFAEGVEQFDLHQTVNSQDVENAVWRFLCMAKTVGVDQARAKLLKIDADDRPPMAEIHRLFAGTATEEEVLRAADRPRQLPIQEARQKFYANLYLGLYFEALGQPEKSLEYIRKAAAEESARDYMGDVARVHLQLRAAGKKAAPAKREPAAKAAAQNPSPMVEHTRAHPRLKQTTPPGRREKLAIGTLFVPEKLAARNGVMPLFVHFHGGTWLPETAAAADAKFATVAVQLGSGSSTYAKPFGDQGAFGRAIEEAETKIGVRFEPLGLTAWSAGYGAVRSILTTPKYYSRVAFVVLIDGMHASYVGGKPGPLESKLETAGLAIFLRYARDAVAGKKRMIVTHSEIFPGTFASTTETSDWLIRELGLQRKPTLEWGPMGTQQLSEVRAGNLLIRGYAGNSAPDHVDQLHSLPEYLRWLDR